MISNGRPWLGQVPLVMAGARRPMLAVSEHRLTDATFGQALSAPAAVVDFSSPG